MIIYDNYATLVSCGLKTKESSDHWFLYLSLLNKRQTEQTAIVKIERRKHPGLTNDEILAKYTNYLAKEFSVPSFPWTLHNITT